MTEVTLEAAMAIRSALQWANKARGAWKDHGDTPVAGPFRMGNPDYFLVELGVPPF